MGELGTVCHGFQLCQGIRCQCIGIFHSLPGGVLILQALQIGVVAVDRLPVKIVFFGIQIEKGQRTVQFFIIPASVIIGAPADVIHIGTPVQAGDGDQRKPEKFQKQIPKEQNGQTLCDQLGEGGDRIFLSFNPRPSVPSLYQSAPPEYPDLNKYPPSSGRSLLPLIPACHRQSQAHPPARA